MKNKNAALNDSLTVLVLLFLALAVWVSLPFYPRADAAFYDNTTVTTKLNVTNAPPTIHNTIIYDDNGTAWTNDVMILNEGTIDMIYCNASVRDTNGWADINKSNATLFLHVPGPTHYGEASDRDYIYANDSCQLDSIDGYNGTVSCTFKVFFHAEPGAWNCSVYVVDQYNYEATDFADTLKNISKLFALELNTTTIDYGNLAVGDVSGEEQVNIKNTGNSDINISVDGYGSIRGDGLAMNCSFGTSIAVGYERYAIFPDSNYSVNMTSLTSSPLTYGIANLTIIETDDDTANSTNLTYWRISVPFGVEAGPCNGSIVFSAVGNEA